MDTIPEGLVTKFTGFAPTGNPNVLRPTIGTVGSQYVRFYIHREYSGADSNAAGKEMYRDIEMCEIRNDHFTKCATRVKDLSAAQKRDLASIYERFKSQKDSKETNIADWQAALQSEKEFLSMMGIYTVEQLFAFSKEELYKLGPGGADLHERARRHMETKETKKSEEDKVELMKVVEENAKLKAEFAEFRKQLEERKPTARPKKIQVSVNLPEQMIQQAQEASASE